MYEEHAIDASKRVSKKGVWRKWKRKNQVYKLLSIVRRLAI